MPRPRVIIADCDVDYIIPLQLKFVEEFFGKIDLEIITDKDYFSELFSNPQKADILIVSEELYDYSLHKHNLDNIFVLTEQEQEDSTDELNLKRIYKYTSIREIFIEVTGNSGGALDVGIDVKKETQVVLVYSAAGGAGKTTLATGLAASLSKNYKKVLYIGAEHLQSFQYILDNPSPIASDEVYAKVKNPNERIYEDLKTVLRKEGFTYIPPFKASLISLSVDYSFYQKVIASAKRTNEYEFIVVDADSVFDEEKAVLFGMADKVIVVTGQDYASVFATNRFVSNVNGVKSDKYIFICNDFVADKSNAVIECSAENKFVVSEYLEHFESGEKLNAEEMLKSSSMQRIAYMLM